MSTANLSKIFNPNSIAVIGASRSKKKVGGAILSNLLEDGFQGRLYVINPNATQIQKKKSLDTILEIPEIVDVAIITVPSQLVEDIVLECGQKGVKNIIIISSGYSEIGPDGLKREMRLRELVERFQLNVLGPNCLGLINAKINLNLSFANNPSKNSKGKVSMISQSGAIGTAFLSWAQINNIEVSKFVSLGNKINLNELDFLEYLEKDRDTDVILMYLEEFSNGREFYELAKLITHKKPLVILKPGKTETSTTAMSAHTGSLATSDKIVNQALLDSGCIRVDTIEQLFNITKLLTWQPQLNGNKVAIITNAGGVAIDAIDQLNKNGLDVPKLPKSLRVKLESLSKDKISTLNPIDLLGAALAQDYKLALEEVIKSKFIDCVFVLLTPQFMTESLKTAMYVNKVADKYKKVVLTSFIGGEEVSQAKELLTKEKLPNFDFTNDASSVLGKVWRWRKQMEKTTNSRLHYPTVVNPNLKVDKDRMLDIKRTQDLLNKFDIKYLESQVFTSSGEVRKNIHKLKFPIVLKLLSPKLVHKTELKAVRLPIYHKSDLLKEIKDLDNIVLSERLDEYKFEIQPFIFQKLEMILGVNKDTDQVLQFEGKDIIRSKGFGHIMLLGMGGIYTEVLDDTTLRLLPINRFDALEMINSIKMGEALLGARKLNYNYKALVKMIVNLSRLIERNSNIKSIDINPVFVTFDEAYAVDVKIFPE